MGLPSITSAPQRVSSSGPGFALAEQENSCGLEERKDLVFLLHRNEDQGKEKRLCPGRSQQLVYFPPCIFGRVFI